MHSRMWNSLLSVLTLSIMVLIFLLPPATGFTARSSELESDRPGSPQPQVVRSNKHDLSPPLRDIQPARPLARENQRELPHFSLPKADRDSPVGTRDNMVIQETFLAPNDMPAPLQSFNGLPNLFGGWPPDTQGDIGPNHYVQWNNIHFAIWEIDKENNTAALVYGPVPGNTLFSGFGGACEATNDGDPITLYDQFADRWLMTQFALPYYPYGPFYECVAVSQTSDPTGAWNRYEFLMPVNKMNDYPKFAVWPDAYYMTVNQFNANSLTWGGAGVAALDRAAMVAGNPASMVYFDLYEVDFRYGGMLPADFDGLIAPPAGALGIFAEWDDSSWMGSNDAVRIWEFDVDWDTPEDSTFGLSGHPNNTIPTADVDPNMCGYDSNCIPQPGTSVGLDAISDRLMHRLQYRNFGDYQTLLTNHTVDASTADHAGIHWFELRDNGSGWGMYQEGVFAPDSEHRWMGSIAMDHVGNIGLGYSLSSSSTFPSVAYAGRLSNDPAGTLPQGEGYLVAGTGSQTGTNRWGDYSMMGLDPDDDCTFWYTQEYIEVTGSNTWKTRIGSFRFPNCSLGPNGLLEGTVTGLGYCDADPAALVEAQVVIQGGQDTYTVTTGVDGSYSLLVDRANSPVDVRVTHPEYESGEASGVTISAGTTTRQDFDLRWLQPCVSAAPDVFQVSVTEGFSTTLPLTLTNNGALAGSYEISSEMSGETLPGQEAAEAGWATITALPALNAVAQTNLSRPVFPTDIWLESSATADVSWLTLDPISGTLLADSYLEVGVSFDATAPDISGPGEYLATMLILSDDPVNSSVSVPVSMRVIPLYGVAIGPDSASLGVVGTTVDYSLVVTNTGNGSDDRFDLRVNDNAWTTTVPASVGPLAPGESVSVPVSVDIPPNVLSGVMDVAAITAASQADRTKTSTATITTTGVWRQFFLPNIYYNIFIP